MITFDELKNGKKPIAVVGLGYVGLPLAVELSKHFDVIGFEISEQRVAELRDGHDRTREVEDDRLQAASVAYTADPAELGKAGIIIVAVPTPIDKNRTPDLGPVRGASTTVGEHMSEGAVVVYESTVYPGLTEEICVPILAEQSGLKPSKGFFVGYSPERINPGDKEHTLTTITKVVAGENEEVLNLLDSMYSTVVAAGTHRASSIRVAEAAKVIENTQRDLNIALMNELACIFDRMDIDTLEVLEAAGTKWNFLPFRPGLVGGHCIGVDPYYLTWKAEEIGFHPEVILAGRKTNDSMGKFIAEKTFKRLVKSGCDMDTARVGIFGLTFKENVPDLRNTRVTDVIAELSEYGFEILVHDSLADGQEAQDELGVTLSPLEAMVDLDAIILAVNHAEYTVFAPHDLQQRSRNGKGIVIDIKGMFAPEEMQQAGIDHWRL